MLLIALAALTTAFLESPVAAFAFRRRDGFLYVLLISALVNLLTNLLLNALCLPALAASPLGGVWGGLLGPALAELVLAYLGEGLLYRVLVENVSFLRALPVSALGNTISLGLSLILSALLKGDGLRTGYALLCAAAGVFWGVCLAWGIVHERNG